MFGDNTTLIVLDVDRTLIKSVAFSGYLIATLARLVGLTVEQQDQLTREIEQSSGRFFDYLTYAVEHFAVQLPSADRLARAMIADYIEDDEKRAQFVDSVIIPGFGELLGTIDHMQLPVILMTAGNMVLQQVKVKILQEVATYIGYGAILRDFVVTDRNLIKDRALAACFSDMIFEIDRLRSVALLSRFSDESRYRSIRRVVIADDKPKYLRAGDSRVIGILVLADGDRSNLDRQLIRSGGIMPRNLMEVAQYLRTLHTS